MDWIGWIRGPVGTALQWFEAHPGTASWLGAIGSINAIVFVYLFALYQGRRTRSHENTDRIRRAQGLALDSSLRDVKQDDSNNEVAPSRSGEQIDDVLDGVVGAVVGGFESAVWAMLRVRTAVEAAVGKWSAQLFVEEQK